MKATDLYRPRSILSQNVTEVCPKMWIGRKNALRAYVCLVLSQKKIKFATENDVKSYASY